MGFFDGIIKGLTNTVTNALPIAAGAASLMPGGAALKGGLLLANNLISGSKADQKARAAMTQQQAGYNDVASQAQGNNAYLNQQLMPIMQQYQQLIGDGGIPQFDARYRSMIEGNAPGFDNAVAQTFRDFGDRGIGAGSSVVGNAVSQVRNRQASEGANFSRGIISDAMQNRADLLTRGIPMLNQQIMGNNQLRMQALGNLGGVGGMYASRADNAMGSLGKLGGSLSDILKLGGSANPDAGNNSLGTNQSPSMWNPVSESGGEDYGWGTTSASMPTTQKRGGFKIPILGRTI